MWFPKEENGFHFFCLFFSSKNKPHSCIFRRFCPVISETVTLRWKLKKKHYYFSILILDWFSPNSICWSLDIFGQKWPKLHSLNLGRVHFDPNLKKKLGLLCCCRVTVTLISAKTQNMPPQIAKKCLKMRILNLGRTQIWKIIGVRFLQLLT